MPPATSRKGPNANAARGRRPCAHHAPPWPLACGADGVSSVNRQALPTMASDHSHPRVSNHDLRRIAVEAICDPRTIVRYLRGESMSQLQATRIEQAFRALSLESLLALRPAPRSDSTPPPPPGSE